MEIAVSDPLLVLVNNYVKAIRFTLFWLKENVENPNEKDTLGVVHEAKGGMRYLQRSLRAATAMPLSIP